MTPLVVFVDLLPALCWCNIMDRIVLNECVSPDPTLSSRCMHHDAPYSAPGVCIMQHFAPGQGCTGADLPAWHPRALGPSRWTWSGPACRGRTAGTANLARLAPANLLSSQLLPALMACTRWRLPRPQRRKKLPLYLSKGQKAGELPSFRQLQAHSRSSRAVRRLTGLRRRRV